jgi:hypothetical protein
MEYYGPIAIILICGLFAESLLIRGKLRDHERRIRELEESMRRS